jgi:hypothetical protein
MGTQLDTRFAEGRIPKELHDVLLPFPWELGRLHALRLEPTEIAVADLDWMLDLPVWRHEGTSFTASPRDVSRDPRTYADQWDRTMRADVRWPVHITIFRRRLIIIDGIHRLLRATTMAIPTLPAWYVSRTAWRAIRLGDDLGDRELEDVGRTR